jgi:predicted aminopeptidase
LVKRNAFGIILLIFLLFASGCRLAYLLHAGAGQYHLLLDSIPVEEALEKESLSPEQRGRLRLVTRIKDFGEKELGLKKTDNYQTVYLKSPQSPIYTVSASPRDRLERITWWFPVVGRMPYLGFFDWKAAREEKERLEKKDLDVIIGAADAYSTLGWFKDPVTLNLLKGSTLDLVDTILHEMTHTTLYLKGQGEFNEGLAVLVGRMGALLFTKKSYGTSHPLTLQAEKSIEDERLFSAFLAPHLEELERLYNSSISYEEKLADREKIFAKSRTAFNRLKGRLQTDRFTYYGDVEINNAYLLSVELYHRHFRLFEEVLKRHDNSISKTLSFFRFLAEGEGNVLQKVRDWLNSQNGRTARLFPQFAR